MNSSANPGRHTIRIAIRTFPLPEQRPVRLKVVLVLVVLQFLGNIASIPLLQASDVAVEPASRWLLYSALWLVLIFISQAMAGHTPLGLPLLEGQLPPQRRSDWARSVICLGGLTAIAASALILLLNLQAAPATIPAAWKSILASADTAIQEEIFYRFFLLTLLVWVGSRFRRTEEGHPSPWLFRTAAVLSGLLSGWVHVDEALAKAADPAAAALAEVFVINTVLGSALGIIYWKQGLESAIFTHFLIEAVSGGMVVPAYFSHDPLRQAAVFTALAVAGFLCWRGLKIRPAAPADSPRAN